MGSVKKLNFDDPADLLLVVKQGAQGFDPPLLGVPDCHIVGWFHMLATQAEAELQKLAEDGVVLRGARRKGGATRTRDARSAEMDTRLAQVAREVWLANGRCWRRGDTDKIRRVANLARYATDERIRNIKRAVEQE